LKLIPLHIDEYTIKKVEWVVLLLVNNHGVKLELTEQGDFTIGFENADILLSQQFYKDLSVNIYNHEHHMKNGPWISLPSGEIDYLSSIFYLVNSLQEYGSKDLDHYGRFKYENSLQKKWGIITKNLVWEYIQDF